MKQNARRWYLEIVQMPMVTEARYGHVSQDLGHQLWDVLVWPLPITPLTERAILSELYAVNLALMETRA